MTSTELFDLFLGLILVGLAWRVVVSRDLFKAVVLFIIFGLLVALAWARLEAPDLALAEAAVGSGVTGILLLNALKRLPDKNGSAESGPPADGEEDDHPTT
jgi:energy-converting hydrogenase B subunit D